MQLQIHGGVLVSGGSAAKRKVFKVSEKNKEMKLSLVACRILLATIFIQNFNVHANGRGKKTKCFSIPTFPKKVEKVIKACQDEVKTNLIEDLLFAAYNENPFDQSKHQHALKDFEDHLFYHHDGHHAHNVGSHLAHHAPDHHPDHHTLHNSQPHHLPLDPYHQLHHQLHHHAPLENHHHLHGGGHHLHGGGHHLHLDPHKLHIDPHLHFDPHKLHIDPHLHFDPHNVHIDPHLHLDQHKLHIDPHSLHLDPHHIHSGHSPAAHASYSHIVPHHHLSIDPHTHASPHIDPHHHVSIDPHTHAIFGPQLHDSGHHHDHEHNLGHHSPALHSHVVRNAPSIQPLPIDDQYESTAHPVTPLANPHPDSSVAMQILKGPIRVVEAHESLKQVLALNKPTDPHDNHHHLSAILDKLSGGKLEEKTHEADETSNLKWHRRVSRSLFGKWTTKKEEPINEYHPTVITHEDRWLAGCLMQCVFRKNNAVDNHGYPTLDGLTELYTAGTTEQAFFIHVMRSVDKCLKGASIKHQIFKGKVPIKGETCDVAFDVFDCVSDSITEYCS